MADYLSFGISNVKIGGFLPPEKLFPEKLQKNKKKIYIYITVKPMHFSLCSESKKVSFRHNGPSG